LIPLSVLDLAPIVSGHDAADALRRCLALARQAEACGYRRYWLAEHHNMEGLACSATVVLIGHIAAGTQRIRIGSGGIMLPNHAPLVVAEQFGTLATLHPGRIDLGLGRAPGTDRATMHALRRTLAHADEQGFPQDVMELQAYLAASDDRAAAGAVQAIPGVGTAVPIWLLGSSTYSARLAAHLGLPFAFASHFAPNLLDQALAIYRGTYRPSAAHPEPHAMVAVNVVAADETSEARRLFTSMQQRFLSIIRGRRGPLPLPVTSMDGLWSHAERAEVERMLAVSVVGDRGEVRAGLQALHAHTGADELIVTGAIHDPAAMLRSYQLTAEAAGACRE
jgi:luciferase family oxidoreductase group 1